MKIRAHRALLKESMETVEDIPPTRAAVYNYFCEEKLDNEGADETLLWLRTYSVGDIEVKPYGYDPRINWDTHIVTLKGDAVGFTDGPLKEERKGNENTN